MPLLLSLSISLALIRIEVSDGSFIERYQNKIASTKTPVKSLMLCNGISGWLGKFEEAAKNFQIYASKVRQRICFFMDMRQKMLNTIHADKVIIKKQPHCY